MALGKNIRDNIKLLGAAHHNETTYRYKCLNCGGGQDGEHSLTITNVNNTIKYLCHRASCGIKGVLRIRAEDPKTNFNVVPFPTKTYDSQLVYLKPTQIDALSKAHGLSKDIIHRNNWQFAIYDNALYFPLYNLKGEMFAEQVKYFDREHKPKTKLFLHSHDDPLLHFPLNCTFVNAPKIIVVEDVISATRLCTLHPAVAILGTTFNFQKAQALRKVSDTLVFALDPDTWAGGTSIGHKYKKEFGALFDTIKVVRLTKDPKDCGWAELATKLK